MAIKYVKGDLWKTKKKWIVVPVNIPPEDRESLYAGFTERFPGMIDYFKQICENTEFFIGRIGLWTDEKSDMYIIFFPVREPWGGRESPVNIRMGLNRLKSYCQSWKIEEVAFPKIGADIPSIDWDNDIKPLFGEYLDDTGIDVEVYV